MPADLHLKVPGAASKASATAASSVRSMRSGTTAGDSDFIGAESCVAESCASFEFVDDDDDKDDDDDEGEEDKTEMDQLRSHQAPSPPKLLLTGAEPVKSAGSAVCSPSSTSEIGSVFGLRFDPLENKMTLQLTADPVRSPQPEPAVDASKLQPTR